MQSKRVEDVMIPLSQYPNVDDSMTIAQGIVEIEKARIQIEGLSSLPRQILVFDGLGVLVGYVRRRDIIRGLEPDFLSVKPDSYKKKLFDVGADPALSWLSFEKSQKGLSQRAQKPISEFLQPIESWVMHDDLLTTAMAAICTSNKSLVPVIKNDQVVGVVRTAELLSELAAWLKIK